MPLPSSEIAQYRTALRDVDTLAQNGLLRAWKTFDLSNAIRVKTSLTEVLVDLIGRYHLIAATVAADWYDLMRVDSGVRARFPARIPEAPDAGRALALAGFAVSPLFSRDPQPEISLTKASGGLQRIIANGARDTIVLSSLADPRAAGWDRAVSEGACPDYCRKQTGSRTSADFGSHDHCHCDAVPIFG